MKTKTVLFRIFGIGILIIVLASCTVYKTVPCSPNEITSDKVIMLHKDELRFRLVEPTVKHNTLIAKVSDDNTEPNKGKKMIVVLKPAQEIMQDSLGVLMISFSQIDFIEYYKLDHEKTQKTTMVGVLAGIALFLTFGMISIAVYGFN